LGDGRAVNPLIESLKDENPWVKFPTAIALGRIGDVSAVPALSESLNDVFHNFCKFRSSLRPIFRRWDVSIHPS